MRQVKEVLGGRVAGVFFQVALGALHFKTPFIKYISQILIYPRFLAEP